MLNFRECKLLFSDIHNDGFIHGTSQALFQSTVHPMALSGGCIHSAIRIELTLITLTIE